MNGQTTKLGILMIFAASQLFLACAPPSIEGDSLVGGRKKVSTKTDPNEEDDDDNSVVDTSSSSTDPDQRPASTSAGKNAGTTPAAPPAVGVSFGAASKLNFNGMGIARVCSDRGAHHQNATFVDGTSLRLVSVDSPDKVIAKVEGAEFQALKTKVLATGEMNIPITNVADLPTQPYEFAIIMGGDSRFGSPSACKASLKPKAMNERDVEEFPNSNTMMFNTKVAGTGCAIVGFIEAYYDTATAKVVARPSSQLLLAADNEGRAGFPAGNKYPGCDGHDSPLVLDLESRGVSLSAPVSDVFDVDGDGVRDESPWLSSGDTTPFLVRDANGNGVVDGVNEMFGNRTKLPTSFAAPNNGFEALAAFDDRADGVIDSHDKVWSTLRLWFDRNHDGRTDEGELETLESRGVKSIQLDYVPVYEKLVSGGHLQGSIRQRGGATMSDGRVVNVVDVWFERKLGLRR